jgi:glycerate 2-kinase
MDHFDIHQPNLNKFLTHSLKAKPWGLQVARILNASISAVNPYSAVLEQLEKLERSTKNIFGRESFGDFDRIKLIGTGKAGLPMAEAAQSFFDGKLTTGIVIVKDGYTNKAELPSGIRIFEASHPLPDQRGVKATHEIIDLIQDSHPNDLVICLISGGGSALMISPVPEVSLDEMQQLTDLLLASGATINEINTLRKHLDQVKGGQLARLASPAKVLCLILSDVVGDPLDVIASGPTVPDPTTFQDSLDILDLYGINERIPATIRTHLEQGQQGKIPETPKSGANFFSNVSNIIVGSNLTATEAAISQAKIEGFNALTLTNYLQGEASQAGIFLASILNQMALKNQPLHRPACVVFGGETTVTIKGNGMGGRNQELALGSVTGLAGLNEVAMVTLATDGGDGPSDAAGAVVTGDTMRRARDLGLNPKYFLDNNDAYHFFTPLNDLIKIGPTKTNVNDLTFLFTFSTNGTNR